MRVSGRMPGDLSGKIFAERRQKVNSSEETQAPEEIVPEKEGEKKKGTEWPLLDPRIEALANPKPKEP